MTVIWPLIMTLNHDRSLNVPSFSQTPIIEPYFNNELDNTFTLIYPHNHSFEPLIKVWILFLFLTLFLDPEFDPKWNF